MKRFLNILLCVILLPLMVACKAETVDLTFMVYNYTTEELGEIKVNGKGSTISGAAEQLGSVGGSGTA
ncbi:hypothetical protein, partial [Bacteroides uniformis]|uniref:hypothetical protein n=1 Tax=Bacteroides uniformis TaxID=820 RepID=UPI001EE0A9E0